MGGTMGRRGFLAALSAGTLAALVAAVESARGDTHPPAPARTPAHPLAPVAPLHPGSIAKVLAGAAVSQIPGQGPYLALTVDDGTNSEVVGAYLDLARATGLRMTFFPNGQNQSWTEHAAVLRPLIESGQIQIGNHTWSHPDLTTLTDAQIANEINRNEAFFRSTYGVSARPYLRPPYGAHDERVDRIAAELGYSTIVMWWGSLGDSSVLTPAQILANAREWFHAQRIVIGHANHPPVTETFQQMLALIRERHLQTVTLNDVFTYAR
jgi:peptidoglycan/xylan/chitin deacetylase (PgdA/CDA1 family)